MGSGNLAPCGTFPNCVRDRLPLFSEKALDEIETFFQKNYRAKTVVKRDNYLHIVISTPVLRFKDDVEFVIEDGKIDARSAARVGYYDFGVNQGRLEKLKKNLSVGR